MGRWRIWPGRGPVRSLGRLEGQLCWPAWAFQAEVWSLVFVLRAPGEPLKGFRLGVMLSDLCFRRLFWLLGGEWTGGARGGAGD